MKQIAKMMEKKLAGWLMFVACALACGVAEATETVFKPAWSQTFEGENLTLADLASQGFALSDTSGTAIYLDTRYTSATASQKFLHIKRDSATSTVAFTTPNDFAVTTAYTVEFDWFYCTGYGQSGTVGDYGHIDVYGSGSSKWLFRMQARADTYAENGYLAYNGDTSNVTGIGKGVRGGNPASKDQLAYWYHFVISGTPNGATKLTVTTGNGTAVATDVTLSDSFVTITNITGVVATRSWNENGGIDNIVLSVPSSAATYTWTDATGDGCWTTVGNWTVDGSVPLAIPTSIDEVSIPASKVVRIPATGVEYSKLTLGEGAKLGVMFEAADDTFTIPDGLTASDITVIAPFTATTSGSTLTAARATATYTWNTGSGDWGAKNFLINKEVPCAMPLNTDSVVIPASDSDDELVITIAGFATGSMTLNRAVTLTGSAELGNVTGQYTLTLKDFSHTGGPTVDGPLCVKGSVYTIEAATKYSDFSAGIWYTMRHGKRVEDGYPEITGESLCCPQDDRADAQAGPRSHGNQGSDGHQLGCHP